MINTIMQWMKKPFRCIATVMLAALILWSFVPIQYTFLAIRALAFAVSVGIVTLYTGTVCRLLRKLRELSSGEGLILGIWMTWLGIGGHMALNIVAQHHAFPPSVVHSWLGAAFSWLAITGGVVQLFASQGLGQVEEFPSRAEKSGSIIVAAAVLIVTISVLHKSPEAWWKPHLPEAATHGADQ